MTTLKKTDRMATYKKLCAKVLAYNEGQGQYNFSHLDHYDRDNAAYDAWQEIKTELKQALAEPESEHEGPTDEELLELSEYHSVSYTMIDGTVVYPFQSGKDMRDDVLSFARAVLARWGSKKGAP